MAVSHPPTAGAPSPPARAWSAERLERLAPLTGIAAIAFFVAGGIVYGIADMPDDEAPAVAYVAYFDREDGPIYGGTLLVALGLICFLWFAGALRARLAAAEGGTHRLSSLAFGGVIATAALILGAVAPHVSATFALEEDVRLTPEAAQALYFAGEGVFFVAWYALAVLFLASAVVMLRTHALPAWLGWATLAIGVLLLVPWVGWAAFLFLTPLWTIVVALLLWRHPEAPHA